MKKIQSHTGYNYREKFYREYVIGTEKEIKEINKSVDLVRFDELLKIAEFSAKSGRTSKLIFTLNEIGRKHEEVLNKYKELRLETRGI